MKINIIQFDPVIGGETTLTNALSKILRKKYDIRVIHPCHVGKKGKVRIGSGWGKVEGEEFLSYSQTHDACQDADFIFCVNAKHVKGSVKSDKRAIAQADSDSFFNQFSGKNFIFYEHGFHTWRLYNYEKLFSTLIKNNNTIRVLTNTKMAIDFYATKNYNAYLCRQPFNPELYDSVTKNDTDTLNICFNSRYSATKGPHIVLPFFDNLIKKGLNFRFNFHGNINDPVSIWHKIKYYFLDKESEINIKPYVAKISDIYDKQDYTLYAGYLTREERGKIEYAILESIYYEIPIIAHPDVFEFFRYDEYGITPEQLKESFIELTPENLKAIIDRKFDGSSYAKNAKIILQDFLPETILNRFDNCINSPASKGRTNVELF